MSVATGPVRRVFHVGFESKNQKNTFYSFWLTRKLIYLCDRSMGKLESKKDMSLAGLEPAIFCSEDQRLIHEATGPSWHAHGKSVN